MVVVDYAQVISDHYDTLLRAIDPTTNLINRLRLTNVISKEDADKIKTETSIGEKIESLLMLLMDAASTDRRDACFGAFIKALRISGQDHIANLFDASSEQMPTRQPMSHEHCAVLNGKLGKISEVLDPECGIVDMLFGDDVFTDADQERISSLAKAGEIVRKLLRKPDAAFNRFMAALHKTGQDHVVYVITGDSTVGKRPVREEFLNNMRKQRVSIVDCMEPKHSGLLDMLVSSEVIHVRDYDRIDPPPSPGLQPSTEYDMNLALLRLLPRRPQESFDKFIVALVATQQSKVAQLFTGEEVNGKMKIIFKCGVDEAQKGNANDFMILELAKLLGDGIQLKTELMRVLTGNELTISYVKEGCIAIGFRCHTVEALQNLRKLHQNKELGRLFTEAYTTGLAEYGGVSLSLKISEEEFARCETNFEQNRLMTPVHRQALLLAVKSPTVLEHVTVSDELFSYLSLCERRKRAVKSATGVKKAATLFEIVSRQPDWGFDQLLYALRQTRQTNVVDFLLAPSLILSDDAKLKKAPNSQRVTDADMRNSELEPESKVLVEDPETAESTDLCSTPLDVTTHENCLIELMSNKINDLEINQKWLAVRLKQAEEEGQRLLFYDAERKILKEQLSSGMRTEKELTVQLKEILANVQRQMFERNSWQMQSDVIQAGVVQQLQDDPMKGDEIQDDTVPPYEVVPLELHEMILLKTFTLFFKIIPVYNSLGSISAPGMPGFNCGVGLMTEQDRLCMASIPCYMTLSVVCDEWHMTMIGWPTSPTRHWFKNKLHRALQRLIKENQYVLSHNYELLSRCLVVTDELLDGLASIGLIRHKTSDIKRHTTDFAKTDAFLRILWEIPQSQQQSVFDALRSALRQDGQEHVANIFLSESDASPMSDEHYQKLVSKQEQLSQCIDPLSGLIDELVNCDIFTDRDRNLVKSEAGDDAMSHKLVDIFMRKPDSAFDKFTNALCITSQEHVASLLGYDTECIPLTEERRKLLVDKAAEVAEIMEAGSLLDILVANDVLTTYNEKQIKEETDNETMSHQLLKILQRQSNTNFDKFILALCKTNQEHVASLLGKDTANIPMTAEHRQLLTTKTKELCNFINPSLDLLNGLEMLGVFTRRDVRSVREKTTYDEMSLELINILVRKSDISFDKFVQALNVTGQEHVASLLGHECSEKPMTEEHRLLLISKSEELSQFMNPTHSLLNKLVSVDVLSKRDIDSVMNKSSYTEISLELVNILLRKSDSSFDKFIDALNDTEQQHVVHILTGQGESPLSHVRRLVLRKARKKLISRVDTMGTSLLPELISSGVLTDDDKLRIEAHTVNEGRAAELVDIIARKSHVAYDMFIKALKDSGHSKVAIELEGLELRGIIDPHFLSDVLPAERSRIAQIIVNNMQALFTGKGDDFEELKRLMEQNGFVVSEISEG